MAKAKGDPPPTPEKAKGIFAEWATDYAARKQITEGLAKETDGFDKPPQERDSGREM